MAQRPRVLSAGEHPIHLYPSYEIDVASAKLIPHVAETEAEGSQTWSESHDESALSSPSDEQLSDLQPGGDEIEDSPAVRSVEKKLLFAYKYKRSNTSSRRNRNLGHELVSNTHTSSNDDHSNEEPESESYSSPSSESSGSEDAGSDPDLQVAQTGKQFEDRDGHVEDVADGSDIDLDAVKYPPSKASAAAVAPFRDGGLPNIPRTYLKVGEPSEITDFGELIYAKSGKNRPPNSGSSNPSRSGERRSAKKTLQQRLFSNLQLTHQAKKDFFPRNVLSNIINQKSVREELHKHPDLDTYNSKTIAEYARRICEETEFMENGVKKIRCFRKIFVILVLIEKTPAIIKFLDKGVNDSDLPLEKVERNHERGAYDLRLSRNPTKRLKCFSKQWNQLHIRNFEEFQWTTLSPFFGKGGHKEVKHYPLQDQVILPFIEVVTRKGRTSTYRTLEFEGGFGRVFKVDIHPNHHNFDCVNKNTKNQSFAIKCLHSPDKIQFKKEVEMLKKFSNPAHPHLISLLATYEQFKSYFLIFHWAEADLQRYWRVENDEPTMDRETVLWLAQQCRGIADGVVTIHQYTTSTKLQPQPPNKIFGHHGDIKPENVLLFPDSDYEKTKRGTLKLSDFGLAEFSHHHTVSMQPKSSWATSPPYRAPEVDLLGTGAIGRSYDIWTMGCLYLECITWLIGGWSLVEYFACRRMEPDPYMFGEPTRTFFKLVKIKMPDGEWANSAEIKPSVIKFIDEELYSHGSCTKFLRDFLDMIKNDLLVIETNDLNKRGRKTCVEVLAKLCEMLRKCEDDNKYACEPVPPLDAMVRKVVDERERRGFDYIDTVNLPEAGSAYIGVSDIKQFD